MNPTNKFLQLSRWIILGATALTVMACSSNVAKPPADQAIQLLESNERVVQRMGAQLMHGHDMTEPSYETPDGYQPIEIRQGELLITDRRLLFIEATASDSSSWVSIPYAGIARARPSRTPLLSYLVVWDAQGHPDSFLVNAKDVQLLHRSFGQAMMSIRQQGPSTALRPTPRHVLPDAK